MKKIIHQLHLWLGLASSLILFLICLSGTVLTFRQEIEELLDPETYHITTSPSRQRLPVDDLIQKLENQFQGKVASFVIPKERTRSYQFNVKIGPEDRRGKAFYVNPYTGEVLNDSGEKGGGIFFFFFRLHRWLLLDTEIGRPIVGIATMIFSFLLMSGLYLWWPKSRTHLKNSLKIKFTGNWKRINYDLHNSLGFYAVGFLLIMSLTGLFWSFEWYRNIGSLVLQTKVFDRGGEPAQVASATAKLPLHQLLEDFSVPGKKMVMLPPRENLAVTVLVVREGLLTVNSTDKYEMDPYSGKVLKHDKYSDKTFGQKIASLIKPLHTGEFMGTFSKIIYFISCLIGTSLPITGFFIWFNKRRKNA